MPFIRLLLSIILLFFIGYPASYYLLINKSTPLKIKGFSGWGFTFFISFYAGGLFASLYFMVLSILSIKFSLNAVLIFSMPFFAFYIYLFIKKILKDRRFSQLGSKEVPGITTSSDIADSKKSRLLLLASNKKLINSLFAIFILLIAANFIVVIFFNFLFPIRFWDAISCWSLKGRAFFINGSIFPFYTLHDYSFSHPSYPLYVPLLQTWIYTWLGTIDEILVKIMFCFFYLSIIFIFYFLFSQKFNRLFSIILVFIFSTIPIIMDYGYIEYTNLLFSIILFLAVYFFYLYCSSKPANINLLILAGLFFTVLAHIRSEGVLFLLLFFIINTTVILIERFKNKRLGNRQALLAKLLPIFLSFFLLLPWLIIRYRLGLSAVSSEWSLLFSSTMVKDNGLFELFNLPGAAKAMTAEFLYSSFDSVRAFLGSFYGVIWVLMLVVLLFNLKRSFRNYSWIFFVFIISGFTVLFISLALVEEFIWSTERYILHLFTLTYFWIFYNLSLFNKKPFLN